MCVAVAAAVGAYVAMALLSSCMMSERETSMIDPTGAVKVNKILPIVSCCQNEANDWRGGLDFTMAGVDTELVVSDTSRLETWL